MVANAATLGRSGVHDYLLIRASAVILACYFIFLLGFIAVSSPLTFEHWQHLYSALSMKVFTLIALMSMVIHAWIGVWQILTDYVKNITLRGVLLFAFVVAAFSYLAAGIIILWSV